MSLSEKAIKEFQEIYKKEYGKELPYEVIVQYVNTTAKISGLQNFDAATSTTNRSQNR